ncbi:hypothetical protein GCM10025868_47200 [Angustibacter aerolatus]|uniref:Uncharacterized protein n=1 Tax=Angustibacter aerolatus TaxID=1162965 RepID=A0ABQ6JS01_9ACTN|nr:hypothetical protein GCM10025868_47200 [Angustibacter aerolatus]
MEYDEETLEPASECQVAPGSGEQGPTDGLMGAGFVEIRLTRLLAGPDEA